MPTALITHPSANDHITPPGHPEQVARLAYILDALEDLDLVRHVAPMAAEDDLLRCHPADYIQSIRDAAPSQGWVSLDSDTHMTVGTLEAALRAAGAATKAVDLVMAGTVGNAFCAMRPPGHHAERSTPMGFCFFGNVAIAAKYALDHHGLDRVAVVDFDVHHGNGTQDLLEGERRAFFVSSHQMPLWPGSGPASETGGYGNVMNGPLDPNTNGAHMRQIYEKDVFPAVAAFKPQLILVSAGFDAHAEDPLANLNWGEDDFAWLTDQLCDLADVHCQGRLVSCLEGGYDLDALASSARAHVKVLMERGNG